MNAITRSQQERTQSSSQAEEKPNSGEEEQKSQAPDEAKEKLITQYVMVDMDRFEKIVEEQHQDPQLLVYINYLKRKEVPASYTDVQKKALIKKCQDRVLNSTYEPAALYYVPREPRRGALMNIPLVPRLIIPKKYQHDLIILFHDSPYGGHLGITKTFRKLCVLYQWDTMFDDVHNHVVACRVCQEEKIRRRDPEYLAKRIADPTAPFETVSVDLVGPKSSSAGFTMIVTFVCHFTRYAIAVPIMKKTARIIAQVFYHEVICRYGCPKVLLSDNGTEFNNAIMTELCAFTRTEKIFTSTYRPQSNGVIERFNGTIKMLLHSIAIDASNSWASLIQTAVFAYNTSATELRITPFEAVFGHPARIPMQPEGEELEAPLVDPQQEYVATLKFHLESLTSLLQDSFKNRRSKLNEENFRKSRVSAFQTNDLVMLKDPIAARASTNRPDSEPLWIGPFVVVKRIGEVNYSIHYVGEPRPRKVADQTVHVTRLKPFRFTHDDSSDIPIHTEAVPVPEPIQEIPSIPSKKRRMKLPIRNPEASTPELEEEVPSSIGSRTHQRASEQPRMNYDENQHDQKDVPDHIKEYSLPPRPE